jgi:hypothetical protein
MFIPPLTTCLRIAQSLEFLPSSGSYSTCCTPSFPNAAVSKAPVSSQISAIATVLLKLLVIVLCFVHSFLTSNFFKLAVSRTILKMLPPTWGLAVSYLTTGTQFIPIEICIIEITRRDIHSQRFSTA